MAQFLSLHKVVSSSEHSLLHDKLIGGFPNQSTGGTTEIIFQVNCFSRYHFPPKLVPVNVGNVTNSSSFYFQKKSLKDT